MKHNGFSLFHMLVYLMLFLMMSMFVMSYISTVYYQVYELVTKQQRQLDLYAAYDALKKDIALASPNIDSWLTQSNAILFKRVDLQEDVSWIIRDGRLFRTTGIYNRIDKTWESKISSLVAYGIDGCRIQLHKHAKHHNIISYVTGTLISKEVVILSQFTVVLQSIIL